MKRSLIALVVISASLSASITTTLYPTGTSFGRNNGQAAPSTVQSGDPVIQWNRVLLMIVRTPPAPGAKPSTVHPTRGFAIMHLAIYAAVNAIERTHSDYVIHISAPKEASPETAVAAAAHGTLIQLYPKQKEMLDAQLQESLAQIPEGMTKSQGLRVGKEAAQRILKLRTHDGSDAMPPPYTPDTNPGDYQKTPPNFPEPVFTHWSRVTPFTLTSANQFRPAARPALTSAAYTTAFREVKEFGAKASTVRSAGQTEIAKFWSGRIQNYWNEIAQTAALAHKTTLAQSARLFALLNLTLADDAIALYEAKYAYKFWRPITAIRAADTDNNLKTAANQQWAPVADTPPDPSYPGAHSAISASGAAILVSFFGSDDATFSVRSEALPGVERSFTSFTAAAEEAGVSRIFIGHHYHFDDTAGQKQGRAIAKYVFQNFLVARRR